MRSDSASKPKQCHRCGNAAATLLLRRIVLSCTPCAQKAVESRAKGILEYVRGAAILRRIGQLDSLGKGKGRQVDEAQLSPRGSIALAFSGGSSSRALLDIATRSLQSPSRAQLEMMLASAGSSSSDKPRKSRPVEVMRIDVLYIDDSALFPDMEDQTEVIRSIVEEQGGEASGLNFVPLKLEDIFADQAAQAVECLLGPAEIRRARAAGQTTSSAQSSRQLLLDLFASINPSSVSRASASSARTRAEDLHALLTQRLLIKKTRELGDSTLLLGDNASRTAINLLQGMSKGKGHKWPVEGATILWRDDLLIARPLAETVSKEVSFYNRTMGLREVTPRELVTDDVLASRSHIEGTGMGEKASIGRLTENFIYALEKGVPSTVNTVTRTGGKLTLKGGEQDLGSVGDVLSSEASSKLAEGTPSTSSRSSNQLNLTGLGQKADRLVLSSKTLPRWNGHNACPLCDLPAEVGASDWKGKLSIVGKLEEGGEIAKYATAKAQRNGAEGWVDLHKLLCYACLLVLDVPEEVYAQTGRGQDSEGAAPRLVLPSYVLAAAQARLSQPSKDGTAMTTSQLQPFDGSVEASAHANGSTGEELPRGVATQNGTTTNDTNGDQPTSAGHVARKIGREEMKGKVGEFLLEE